MYYLIFLVPFLLQCASLHEPNGSFRKGAVAYAYGIPNKTWRSTKAKGSDFALVSEDSKGVILFYSKCGIKNKVPLEALSGHVLLAFKDKKLLSRTYPQYPNVEALLSVYEGELDSVKQKMKILTLKSESCFYHIVLSAAEEKFAAYEKDFDTMVKDFSVEHKAS